MIFLGAILLKLAPDFFSATVNDGMNIFKLIFILSNTFSMQKKYILKNGIHNDILYLIAGKYFLVNF